MAIRNDGLDGGLCGIDRRGNGCAQCTRRDSDTSADDGQNKGVLSRGGAGLVLQEGLDNGHVWTFRA